MGIAFDITESDSTVEHGFGTRDLFVQAWQNGYLVTPNVAAKGDNELRVFAAGVSEANPIRLLVAPVSTQSSKEESSGNTTRTEGSATAGKSSEGKSSGGKKRAPRSKAS